MKSVYSALLLAVSAAILLQLISAKPTANDSDCGTGNKTHNFIYGSRSYYDRLLFHDYITYKSKWMRVTSIDKTYPENKNSSMVRISYIEVLDQRSDGTGGCVYIRNGGVGQNFVTLHIKSQRNHGMDFIVNIFGR